MFIKRVANVVPLEPGGCMGVWNIGRQSVSLVVIIMVLLYSKPGASLQDTKDPPLSVNLRSNSGAGLYFEGAQVGDAHSQVGRIKISALSNGENDFGPAEINGFPPVCIESVDSEVELIRLSVVSTRFRCTESMCEHHYDNCVVEIDYELTAETSSALAFETSVSCTADITYGTGHGYILKSSVDSKPEFHDLEPHAPHTYHSSMCFAFSRYEEVITAQLDSVQCRIQSVELK